MIKSQPVANYMEIYPKRNLSQDKPSGIIFAGFALRYHAENDIGIEKVLSILKYKKQVINESQAIVGSMNMTDVLTKSFALKDLWHRVWNYLENTKKTTGVPCKWEEKKKITCGAFIENMNDQLRFLSIDTASITESEVLKSDNDKKNS